MLGVETLALTFTGGWASGVNSYLAILVLGIADRVAGLAAVPDVLASWWVLGLAGAMYVLEFVADKIPYLDSAWDTISTAIRPVVGGVLGVLFAGESADLDALVGAAVGGGSALASHGVKAGTRLAVNTSPEPVTNVGVSLAEDVTVLAVVWFALEYPYAAAGVAAALLVTGMVAVYLLLRLVRRGLRRLEQWRDRRLRTT